MKREEYWIKFTSLPEKQNFKTIYTDAKSFILQTPHMQEVILR